MSSIGSRISIVFSLVLFGVSGVLLFPARGSDAPSGFAGMPENVSRVFERACKDCHSNRTEWPWYTILPPMQKAIAADVNRGRAFFNMSDWQSFTPGRRRGFLAAIQIDLQKDKMPPAPYRWLHPGSRLTAEDRALLSGWAKAEAKARRQIGISADKAKQVLR